MTKRVVDGFVLEKAVVLCPECQSPFAAEMLVETRKVNSSDVIEADLHRVFLDPQIRAALLACCPACHYCAWVSGFKPFKLKAELLQAETKIEPSKKYALAVKWAREKKVHSLDIAFIALNGLWCTRESKEPDALWLELAIFEHVKGMAASPSCPEDDGMAHLIMGELYRQHRDFEKALAEYDLAELDATTSREILIHQRGLSKRGESSVTALPLRIARLYFEIDDSIDGRLPMEFEPPKDGAVMSGQKVAAPAPVETAGVTQGSVGQTGVLAKASEDLASQAMPIEADSGSEARPLLAAISSLFSTKASFLDTLAATGSEGAGQSRIASSFIAPANSSALAGGVPNPAASAFVAPTSNNAPLASAFVAPTANNASSSSTFVAPAANNAASSSTFVAPTADSTAAAAALTPASNAPAVSTPANTSTPTAAPTVANQAALVQASAKESKAAPAAKKTSAAQLIPPLAVSLEAAAASKTVAKQSAPAKESAKSSQAIQAAAAQPKNKDAKPAASPRSRASVITAPQSSSVTVSVTAISSPIGRSGSGSSESSNSTVSKGATVSGSTVSKGTTGSAESKANTGATTAKASTGSTVSKGSTVTTASPESTASATALKESQARKARSKRVKQPRDDFHFARNQVVRDVPPNRSGWINDYGSRMTALASAAPQVKSIREEKIETRTPRATEKTAAKTPAAEAQQRSLPAAMHDAPASEAGAPLPGLAIDDPVHGKDYSDAINRVESYLSFSRRVYSRNWMKI